MKKILVLLSCICVLGFTGCYESVDNNPRQTSFVIVDSASSYIVMYHKDTKVMYVMSNSAYNYGNFTLLVNPDGTPMVYEGE